MTKITKEFRVPEDEKLEIHVTVIRSPGMEEQLVNRELVRQALINVFNLFPSVNHLTKFMRIIGEGGESER